MLTKFLRGALAAADTEVTFVGYALASASAHPTSISLTSLSGGIATSASAGDIVFAVRAFKNATNRTFTCNTSGYTALTDLYANDTNDAQLGVFYKVLTTAETTVQISNSGSVSNGAIGVFVFRGVDTSTPLDVTSTTATITNSGRPDCPSITSVTDNSLILAIGSAAGAGGNPLSDLTAPSGMSNFYQVRTGEGTSDQTVLGMATFLQTTAGAYNPSTFKGGSTSSSNSACAVTIALRPQQPPPPNNFDIVGGTIAYTGSGTSLSVAYPSDIQENDLLLVLGQINSATFFGTISGWTNLSAAGSYGIFSWKVADGTESGTVSATWGGSAGSVMSMFRIRHTTTNPPTLGPGAGVYATSPSLVLPTPASYTDVCHIVNYRESTTINGFVPNSRLILINSRPSSYSFYGYKIEDAAGDTITSTTTNNTTALAYSIYV
jgi:hypothetical protein